MAANIRQINRALYNASLHLFEASRYLGDMPEFEDEALIVLTMAHNMLHIIQPEEQKVSEEKMLGILGEIIGFSEAPNQ